MGTFIISIESTWTGGHAFSLENVDSFNAKVAGIQVFVVALAAAMYFATNAAFVLGCLCSAIWAVLITRAVIHESSIFCPIASLAVI